MFADYDHLAFALFTNITFGYIIAEMALLLAVIIQCTWQKYNGSILAVYPL